jgi:hypothetical protein
MTDEMPGARAAIAELQATDDEQLYRLLALRVKAIERDPSVAGLFAPATIAPAELGISAPDLVDFGRTVFIRLATAGHGLICGSEASRGFHLQRLLSSIGTDVTAVTTAVAALLISQLAIAPAVAGIVATIVVGKVAPASLEALCEKWGGKLGTPA